MLIRLPVLLTALTCAAAGCQFPEYYQQYLQQLAGRLGQAEARVQEISSDARSMGLSTEAYIGKFLDSEVHALEGARMRDSLADAVDLRGTLADLRGASLLTQPFRFAAQLEPSAAKSTFGLFKPAVPLTGAGIAYGLLGALLGASIAGLLLRGGRRLLKFLPVRNVET